MPAFGQAIHLMYGFVSSKIVEELIFSDCPRTTFEAVSV